jgi:tRNA G18 (ribose-2'-O)-methylase SpoU
MHGLPREQRAHLNSALPPVPCLLAVCARRRDQAKFRRAEASAVVVGSAPLRELCAPGGAAQGKLRGLMLLEEDAGDLWHDQFLAALGTAPPVVHVASSAVFQKVAGLESAEGRQAAGEVQMPQFLGPEQLLPAPEAGATVRHVVVLDRVQDPGNVGTLLRTAAGLGWGCLLLDGSCDVFNDKVIRASRGAAWRAPLGVCSLSQLLLHLADHGAGWRVMVADMGGCSPEQALCSAPSSPLLLVLSNEGAGVAQELYQGLDSCRASWATGALFLTVPCFIRRLTRVVPPCRPLI